MQQSNDPDRNRDYRENFLESSKKLFRYYKGLGEKAIEQLDGTQVSIKPNPASNSIALIVHHISGNVLPQPGSEIMPGCPSNGSALMRTISPRTTGKSAMYGSSSFQVTNAPSTAATGR